MVDSERVKKLSEELAGKDLLRGDAKGWAAGALSLSESVGLSFRWKVRTDSCGLITPSSTVSSETGSMIECHVGRAVNGQDSRRSECAERSLRELGFE